MPDFPNHKFLHEEFDYQTLTAFLKDYSRPRDKISDLIRKGVIIRVKKGLYILGERHRKRAYSKELLANLIYGPSYISLDYALQFYGMIPERVEAVTSVTTGRSKRFMTPIGLFIYRSIPLTVFSIGMTRIEINENKAFLIATPEKAICDKIREDRGSGLRSQKEMQAYLIEGLRIEEKRLAEFNSSQINKIACHYRSGKLRVLHAFITQLQKNDYAGSQGIGKRL